MRLSEISAFARDYVHSHQWPRRPETLGFEITAACDARCIHCPREDMDRPMKAMPMPLFRRMIDDAARLGIPYLSPNGYGEICTIPIPALTEYLEYIAASRFRFKIALNTNGYRMNEERAALFLKYVHAINITIDGATKETAEAIRLKLKFDVIEDNIKRLLAMRKAAGQSRPKVRVSMVAMPQTIPEIPAFMARWKGIADLVGIGAFSNRLESVDDAWKDPTGALPESHSTAKQCVLPFRDLHVWSDGTAVICCEDWNAVDPVGNLNTQTIEEVWTGPAMQRVRAAHRARRGETVPLCATCNVWREPSAGARLWGGK